MLGMQIESSPGDGEERQKRDTIFHWAHGQESTSNLSLEQTWEYLEEEGLKRGDSKCLWC